MALLHCRWMSVQEFPGSGLATGGDDKAWRCGDWITGFLLQADVAQMRFGGEALHDGTKAKFGKSDKLGPADFILIFLPLARTTFTVSFSILNL